MDWQYLDLADFLLIAEAVLDLPAEELSRAGRLDLADSALHAPAAEFGGVEFYPDLARNGGTWTYPPNDPEGDETVAIIEGVAAGEVDEDELCEWITRRLA